MLRKSALFRDEFAQATKQYSFPHSVAPRVGYGRPKLLSGKASTFWLRAVVRETTEQNRLVNFRHRWGWMIDEIDTEKLAEVQEGLAVEALMVDDHRRVPFNCRHCGFKFTESIKQRLQYDKNCPKCYVPRSMSDLEVEGGIASSVESLVKHSAEGDSAEALLSKLRTSSPAVLRWNCVDCGEVYSTSVRARFKAATANDPVSKLHSRCTSCRWKRQMKAEAAQYEM